MEPRSVTAEIAILFTTAPLLILLQAVVASEVPTGCSWKDTQHCYFKLSAHAFVSYQLDDKGNINAEEHAKDCMRMTLPSLCSDQLNVCPEDVKANLSSFEEGYRQLRDFICDINAVKGFLKVAASVTQAEVQQCLRKYPVQAHRSDDECSEARVTATCVGKVLQRSSPLDFQTLNAYNKQFHTALMMMRGCELPSEFTADLHSSQATIVPHISILGLVTTILVLHLQSL